jgi:hypothetical protein
VLASGIEEGLNELLRLSRPATPKKASSRKRRTPAKARSK